MKAKQFLESASAGATSSGNVASVSKGLGKVQKRSQKPGTNALDSDSLFGEAAPKGWEGTVKAMKKHKDIDNPYALANYMKNKGYKSHKKEDVAEGKEEKIAQLKKDHETAVHWSKNEKSPQKREAARQKAEKIKGHLEKQYKQGVAEGNNPEYDDEAGMADNNLETLERSVQGIDNLIQSGDNLPEWCQEKIAVAKSMLVTVWDYMYSEKERGAEVTEHKKGVRAVKHTTKPRNFVAKNAAATTSGAGAHKDKKKAAKQGDVKHKNKELTYESKLFTALEKRLKK